MPPFCMDGWIPNCDWENDDDNDEDDDDDDDDRTAINSPIKIVESSIVATSVRLWSWNTDTETEDDDGGDGGDCGNDEDVFVVNDDI